LSAYSQVPPVPEARAAPRERALLQARVSFAGGSMSFSSRVTQISATGARIAIKDDVAIPEHFQIAIPQKGIDCGARLVWRRAGHAGIIFKAAASPSDQTLQNLQLRIQELEAENKALKATIETLNARSSQFDTNY